MNYEYSYPITGEQSWEKKSDVAHQKVHKQDRDDIKVKVNIQSLIHPYIFSQQDSKAKKK